MIQLQRPLIFFDLETTGTNPSTDKIIQFAGIKIYPDGNREEYTLLLNPNIAIPAQASAVHGITDEMVTDQPTFSDIAQELYTRMQECDLAGYNSNNFDVPMLCEEFGRCKIIRPQNTIHLIDVLSIERNLNSHKLANTYKRYTGQELTDAHDALTDTQATLTVWLEQMKKLPELDSIQAISQRTQQDHQRYDIAGKMYIVDDIVYRAFGKNKDKAIHEDLSYCQRVLESDFPYETKIKLQQWIEKNI